MCIPLYTCARSDSFFSIGDWYPERNVFQILIALMSGVRFALVWLQFQLHSARTPDAYFPTFLFWVGILRTFR
jgi:hypothetical protein